MQNAPFILEGHNHKVIKNPLSNVVSHSEIPPQHFGVSDDTHFDKLTRDIIIITNCGHLSAFLPLRACLHGGGGPQIGEVTCSRSPHLSRKRDQIKMRDYMDRRVTPPKRVTSPSWGAPPPCKQALSFLTRSIKINARYSGYSASNMK